MRAHCTYPRSRLPIPLPVLVLKVILDVSVVARARRILEELLEIVLDVLVGRIAVPPPASAGLVMVEQRGPQLDASLEHRILQLLCNLRNVFQVVSTLWPNLSLKR